MTRSSLSLHATCVIAYEKFDEIGHLSNAVVRPHTNGQSSQRLYSKCERLNCRVSRRGVLRTLVPEVYQRAARTINRIFLRNRHLRNCFQGNFVLLFRAAAEIVPPEHGICTNH